MSENVLEPVQRFRRLVEGSRDRLPGRSLDWLEARREAAARAVVRMGLPDRKSEEWRYTSTERLLEHELRPAAEPVAGLRSEDLAPLALDGLDAYRVVFANGRMVPDLSVLDGLPAGVRVESLHAAIESTPQDVARWLGMATGEQGHVFNALNTALLDDGMLLHVAAGVELDKPIELLFLSQGVDNTVVVQPRNLLVFESGAGATLIERHAALGDSLYFNNGLSEIVLEPGARLTHYRLQEESRSAFHLHSLFLRQERDSAYACTSMAMGGSWSRTDLNVDFGGEGASCELDGLYLAGDRQLVDFHLNVQHRVPGCSSRERFRGILHGKGRAVFDGRILVEKRAQKTDAQLSNDNLLLSRSAEVDTKPQLEIYADDVKCSHGTTVGQLEAEQLFYLRSRGITAGEARKMLCLGFAQEILDTCAVDAVRRRAEAALRAALDQVVVDAS